MAIELVFGVTQDGSYVLQIVLSEPTAPKAEQTGWIDVEGLEDYLNGLGYPGADILPWFLPEGDEWVLDESYGSFDLYIADADTTTTFDSVIAELEKGDWTVTAKGDVDTGYGFSITVCNYGICRCLRNDLQPADSGLRHLGHGNVLHLLRSPPSARRKTTP